MRGEKVLLDATLCFPVRGDEVLLCLKTQKIGKGCWNGYGGEIEDGETPMQSILRELAEEAGIKTSPGFLEKTAVICFHNTKSDGSVFVCKVHVFLLHKWEGDFQPTDEMASPTWFKKYELPLDRMMPADREWLPVVLAGGKIRGEARYGPFQKSLLGKVNLRHVNFFPDG